MPTVYPAWCGDDGEPACTADLQLLLGITSCKPGRVELLGVPVGTCRVVDADGYPAFCGSSYIARPTWLYFSGAMTVPKERAREVRKESFPRDREHARHLVKDVFRLDPRYAGVGEPASEVGTVRKLLRVIIAPTGHPLGSLSGLRGPGPR